MTRQPTFKMPRILLISIFNIVFCSHFDQNIVSCQPPILDSFNDLVNLRFKKEVYKQTWGVYVERLLEQVMRGDNFLIL